MVHFIVETVSVFYDICLVDRALSVRRKANKKNVDPKSMWWMMNDKQKNELTKLQKKRKKIYKIHI